MADKAKEGSLKAVNGSNGSGPSAGGGDAPAKKRRRWDMTAQSGEGDETPATKKKSGGWDQAEAMTPSSSR